MKKVPTFRVVLYLVLAFVLIANMVLFGIHMISDLVFWLIILSVWILYLLTRKI